MIKLSLRKAYKISCELKENCTNAKSCISASAKYEVHDALGLLGTVVDELHDGQKDELSRQFAALNLVNRLRLRIQEANNVPLPYAEGATINTLIGVQASLKTLIAFYPEEKDVAVTDIRSYRLTAERNRAILADATNYHRSSTNANLIVNGTSQKIADRLSEERLALRVELESVTGKLAYANITETVELADEEVEILKGFRIPV